MRLSHYFERIGFHGAARPDLRTLRALQTLHVCSVPFENLDVQLGLALTTDVEAAYAKIVENGRGGWCYEQNGVFGWALTEIGFDVTRLSAAVMRQHRGEISAANHLCLRVRSRDSSTDYLADVGFGGSMLAPIRLEEAEHRQPPFRLGLRRLADGHWRFWEDLGNGAFSFDFVVRPADEAALKAKCALLQSDPSSGFVRTLVAQLRSHEQHQTLRGRILSSATPAGIETVTLDSGDAVVAALADVFHLEVPEAASLWPRITARHAEFLEEKADDPPSTA